MQKKCSKRSHHQNDESLEGQCAHKRTMCTQSKSWLNSGVIITTILSATIPNVCAEVEVVYVAEVADPSVLDGETVLALVSKETEMKVKMIQSCLFEIQN